MSAQIQALWSKKACEIVIAVTQSNDKKRSYILHHSELKTLQPRKWLVGETIQCYFQVLVNNSEQGNKIYILDHYTAGIIIHGERDQVRRNSLSKVNFDDYDGLISFLNVDGNHWVFLYVHAASSQVFVVDPVGHDEEAKSMHAACRFREYFKMRRNCLSKNDWVDIKWKGGKIDHSTQQDGYSCGVLVMQMAKGVVADFPCIPCHLMINTSKQHMEDVRLRMAEEILQASVFKRGHYCSACAASKPPGGGAKTVWIECHQCKRWFHVTCIQMTEGQFNRARKSDWKCCLCK
ncbi:uncharacterized protein LOC128027055 [Carassius gibelio]|uniref:uncharacterized protein LOC128027055 n=1 Tax=Carassius gibelio TaxID=101364 RepID=UPI00227987EC|nr:uncharacterized protein LOC128027055 [Carassius gibelio]